MQPQNRIRERSSALGHLMVGAELDGAPTPLNKGEQTRIKAIEKKISKVGITGLTDLQKSDYAAIKKKQSTPYKASLSDGAKTRVQDKWYGERFDYTKRFLTNAMRKGNARETDAIKQLAEFLGYNPKFASKNEKHFEDEYTHGTPDWINRFVFDTKCVWEPKGLDIFKTEKLKGLYEWQVKDYCRHTERDHGAVVRILMNPPENMIHSLAKPLWEEAGKEWHERIDDDFIDNVRDLYDFEGKNPIEDRIVIVRVDYTERDGKLIKQQIDLMNEYWEELDKMNAAKNLNEIDFFKAKFTSKKISNNFK